MVIGSLATMTSGISSHRRARPEKTLSSSPRLLGVHRKGNLRRGEIDTVILNDLADFAEAVAVEVYCSLLSAPMSPAQSMPTGICFLPRTMKMPAAFSGLSAFALNSGVAGVSTPEITLISDSLPTNGSAIVLNTWRGEALAHGPRGGCAWDLVFGLMP